MRLAASILSLAMVSMAVPALADQSDHGGIGTHKTMTGKVKKIRSGLIFVQPPNGLQFRGISPGKAERMGLHEVQPGEQVTLVVDEGNVLVDAHKAGVPPAGHRLVNGRLDYADLYWEEIKLSTPEGIERFPVDTLSGSKLSVFQAGATVTVELDEDNTVIDIHRSR
ncbi:MAG: hypothetical protein AB1411_01540 [Nitrospirota bacterium]